MLYTFYLFSADFRRYRRFFSALIRVICGRVYISVISWQLSVISYQAGWRWFWALIVLVSHISYLISHISVVSYQLSVIRLGGDDIELE